MSLRKDFDKVDKIIDRVIGLGERGLKANYKAALKEINSLMMTAYSKYAKEGVLTFAEMQKFKRYQKLMNTITKQLNAMMAKSNRVIKGYTKAGFSQSYFRYGWAMERNLTVKLGYNLAPIRAIKASVNELIGGATLEQRLEIQKREVNIQIRQEITRGLTSGDSLPNMVKRINNKMSVSLDNMKTIVRTETARNANAGILESYKEAEDAGVELVKVWVASLDTRTRPSHGVLDGEKANEDGLFDTAWGMVEGPYKDAPVEEAVHCRCRTIAEIEDMKPMLRRQEGEVTENITFNEWREQKGLKQNQYGQLYKREAA